MHLTSKNLKFVKKLEKLQKKSNINATAALICIFKFKIYIQPLQDWSHDNI